MAVSAYLYYAPRTPHWSAKIFKPMWLNLGAVLFLPLQLASTIAVFGVSAQRANDAFASFEDFRDQMASLGADWSYGQPFILLVSPGHTIIPLLICYLKGPPYFSSLNTYLSVTSASEYAKLTVNIALAWKTLSYGSQRLSSSIASTFALL